MFLAELSRKVTFASWAIVRHLSSKSYCPSCGSQKGSIIGASKGLFFARRCKNCGLVYRLPSKFIPQFYEAKYHKHANWYLDLHNGVLQKNFENKFHNCKWDYYDKLSLIQAVKPYGCVLDFGGGSGIIAWQFQELGYEVELFEICEDLQVISKNILKLKSISSYTDLEKKPDHSYDVIFLHHVLEHLDDLRTAFAVFDRLLRDDGLLVFFVPNGGAEQWKNPAAVLDSAHVNAFEAAFFYNNLERFGFKGKAFSTPYAFTESGPNANITRQAKGYELAVFAWKKNLSTPIVFEKWPYELPNLEYSERAQAGC